jgi:hypothetical protein
MELRNHPVMLCDGVRTWPPKWLQTYGVGNRSVGGEIGRLEAVFLTRVIPPNRVYLAISTDEGRNYIGPLLFESVASARVVFNFLHKQIGKPLTVIGSMDIPSGFGE